MARGGKREGAGRKLNYESYSKQYDDMQKKLAAKGISMFQRKYTKQEFAAQFMRLKNTRQEQISMGKRKTLGNITRDLIDKQAFELTMKQAKAVKKRQGMTLQELRSGIWLAKEQYLKQREFEEMEVDDIEVAIRKYISTEFFGS